ncbi:E3 ubiquitin/ISG15 ligase TRIM25-like isoform X1 [Ctenopharyngodon idella]|uniref:E3 ubiquitin/ISG15 ligase TRIM25-like isoform X1 n=1 Tax=Ctenopharyngodon idella TaxID=7959 RepID=UPI002231B169|nr:E3 ubiquitin/ISG15 ligase TRIM25-like isoform X1 [Ctenopharyngodon idella]
MAEASISVDQDQFMCPVCLDLLKNPVTIPCGHSYCMSCISGCWNQDDQKGVYRCPQCRQTFTPRPALCKNVVFAEMVEKLKKTNLQAAVPAGSGNVECDVCTGRKHKAVKSCLVCLESYCQTHFERHEEFRSGKPHKVINATGRLQQMICPQHGKQLEIYCRTDRRCICHLCKMDEHKYHDTVTATEERTEKQKHLEQTLRNFQQRIWQREKDLQELRDVVKTHKRSAQKAVEDSERIFTELIRSIERSRSELTQLIRDQENAAVSRVEGLLKQLEQEIDDLRRRNAELEQLSHTDDHIHFLQSIESCSVPPKTTVVPRITTSSHLLYDDVGKSVLLLKNKLEDFCKEEIKMISDKVTHIEIISTSEESIQSPQSWSWATMPGSPSSPYPMLGSPTSPFTIPEPWPRRFTMPESQPRLLSKSKYWNFPNP